MKEFIEEFPWHSSLGFDERVGSEETMKVKRLPNTASIKKAFVSSGGNMLIHKTSQSLWKVSDDGKSIEAVFDKDVLSMEDIEELGGEQ